MKRLGLAALLFVVLMLFGAGVWHLLDMLNEHMSARAIFNLIGLSVVVYLCWLVAGSWLEKP